MRFLSYLLLFCCFSLSACQTTNPSLCVGWTKPPKANDAARMVKIEPQLTRWIVMSDRLGKKYKCWD